MASSKEKEVFSVAPFDGNGFTVWCRRVLSVFSAKELDEFLETEARADNAADILKSKKAYALILSLLNDNILASLQNEDTACKIWKKLQATYKAKGAVSQILTRKRLATIRKSKDVPMRQHIDVIMNLVGDLRISGAEVSDFDIIVYILMSLPKEYESVKVALENQQSDNLTLEFVTKRLIDSEALIFDSRNENKYSKPIADNSAFSSARKELYCSFCKRKGHSIKFCRKKNSVCHACGKTGHFKRECFENSKKQENFNNKQASPAISFVAGVSAQDRFIIDSGATSHMSSHREWFASINPKTGTVKCASKSALLKIEGIGDICGKTVNGVQITLKDVLYVPELNGQLISVKNIEAAGLGVIFRNETVYIETKNERLEFGHLDSCGQYFSNFSPDINTALVANDDLWHRRLGHCGHKKLKLLNLSVNESFCDVCARAKQCAIPMGKGPRRRETKPSLMLHTDICGPIEPATSRGEKYFMTIIDDYSRFMEIRLLKRKSDIVDELKMFFKMNPTVSKIRCDNAKEYVSGELYDIARNAGVNIDPVPPYTPSLNGVAERANRSLLEKARAMIFEANLPKMFWGEAVLTAAYISNRLPNSSIDNEVPYFLKYREHPDLKNMRVFGCDAYALIPSSQRKKLDEKSMKMIFVGYTTMGYRLMNPETRRIIVSRNVKFNEESKIERNRKYISTGSDATESDDDDIGDRERSISIPGDNEFDAADDEDEQRKSSRAKKQPVRYPNPETYEVMFVQQETLTFDDIVNFPKEEQELWKSAMDEEMKSMKENDVWDLENLPPDKRSISCKWVLRKKRDGIYKARLVARGFMQKEGIDYVDTFSPVISMTALRLIFVTIINENLQAFTLDVKTAFLNGKLEETIYMDQPKGYDDSSGKKCRLKKSLYGLKQSPRQWYQKFLNFVMKLDFRQLDSEPCIFIRKLNGKKIILALYVDDLLISGSDIIETNIVISLLCKEFQMSKTERASEFLGIRMHFESNCLYLDQKLYIVKLLDKFKMSDCKIALTPIEPKSTPTDFQKGNVFNGPYRELVGSLLYLAYVSRPDILFAVNCLSQLQENPTDIAWCALKRILRYLKNTLDIKLVYKKSDLEMSDLCLYVDADWGSNIQDRKSVTGYFIMFSNCPIMWCCNKQKCIALSSTEAEIIALCKGLQDLLWIKDVVSEISSVKNVCIFEDNQSCIKSIVNENSSGRLKHIDIKLKFARNIVKENDINIAYVESRVQIADMLTKALPKTKLNELLSLCCLKLM